VVFVVVGAAGWATDVEGFATLSASAGSGWR
jgi:hypothetical protein